MAVRIVETDHYTGKPPIIIEGFPGVGLVGTIAANYLVQKLEMKPMGYMYSKDFPPVAAVHNYKPLYPARLYKSEKHKLIVVLSEFIIPVTQVAIVAQKLWDFSEDNRTEIIVSLGAIKKKEENDGTLYAIASTEKCMQRISKFKDIKLIKEGAASGVTGLLLARGAISNFPVLSLLSESSVQHLDPAAASILVKKLGEILEIKLDTSGLDKEAREIEVKMRTIMEKTRSASKDYKKMESIGQMYG
ncbi:hypothetical protein COT30_02035 [Candidatus Micrarchaeota archaeon CG08_land_8_20_14_0_20_49_17]|nr:MAG: hypothetical protein AUJ13_05975 [Candidatus Micrarchaeota archaeon CG1_02_49_24]PIU09901.1 MAG: hypothetical protein COT30_02035 [Candidatus Micrarchaeota archaeon CG08_land_8_20_14_0_20_49_17]PIZ97236.1 MAG: hypothetical protein COX84_03245 [Candidatus Micrarchaeota archaeon CG_4_10_14_0_2_um_filter_49_7]HII53738.1 proteasome assembly chaperone family protein [Candidatus Micrarchaeota archaeon]